MATRTCPRCEYEITEDENYCEECQWHHDIGGFIHYAPDEDQRDLLGDILFDLFWTPTGYSNSHTIGQERIDKVRKAIDAELKRWKKAKANA